MARPLSARFILLAVILGGVWAAPSRCGTLVGPGEGEWRYYFTRGAIGPELDPNFDDSGWPVGTAPFFGAGYCTTGGTSWPNDGGSWHLVARKHFSASSTPTVGLATLFTQCGGDLAINGVGLIAVGSCVPDCPAPSYTSTNVYCIRPGDNVVVVVASNAPPGAPGFMDVSIGADVATPTSRASWGRLKLIYH